MPIGNRYRDQQDDHYDQNRILNKMSKCVTELKGYGMRLKDVPGDVITKNEIKELNKKINVLKKEIGQCRHPGSDSEDD